MSLLFLVLVLSGYCSSSDRRHSLFKGAIPYKFSPVPAQLLAFCPSEECGGAVNISGEHITNRSDVLCHFAHVDVWDSTFTKCEALDPFDAKGGALVLVKCPMTNASVTNTVFEGCRAGECGGAVYGADVCNMLITGCQFFDLFSNFGSAFSFVQMFNTTVLSTLFRNCRSDDSTSAFDRCRFIKLSALTYDKSTLGYNMPENSDVKVEVYTLPYAVNTTSFCEMECLLFYGYCGNASYIYVYASYPGEVTTYVSVSYVYYEQAGGIRIMNASRIHQLEVVNTLTSACPIRPTSAASPTSFPFKTRTQTRTGRVYATDWSDNWSLTTRPTGNETTSEEVEAGWGSVTVAIALMPVVVIACAIVLWKKRRVRKAFKAPAPEPSVSDAAELRAPEGGGGVTDRRAERKWFTGTRTLTERMQMNDSTEDDYE